MPTQTQADAPVIRPYELGNGARRWGVFFRDTCLAECRSEFEAEQFIARYGRQMAERMRNRRPPLGEAR